MNFGQFWGAPSVEKAVGFSYTLKAKNEPKLHTAPTMIA